MMAPKEQTQRELTLDEIKQLDNVEELQAVLRDRMDTIRYIEEVFDNYKSRGILLEPQMKSEYERYKQEKSEIMDHLLKVFTAKNKESKKTPKEEEQAKVVYPPTPPPPAIKRAQPTIPDFGSMVQTDVYRKLTYDNIRSIGDVDKIQEMIAEREKAIAAEERKLLAMNKDFVNLKRKVDLYKHRQEKWANAAESLSDIAGSVDIKVNQRYDKDASQRLKEQSLQEKLTNLENHLKRWKKIKRWNPFAKPSLQMKRNLSWLLGMEGVGDKQFTRQEIKDVIEKFNSQIEQTKNNIEGLVKERQTGCFDVVDNAMRESLVKDLGYRENETLKMNPFKAAELYSKFHPIINEGQKMQNSFEAALLQVEHNIAKRKEELKDIQMHLKVKAQAKQQVQSTGYQSESESIGAASTTASEDSSDSEFDFAAPTQSLLKQFGHRSDSQEPTDKRLNDDAEMQISKRTKGRTQ